MSRGRPREFDKQTALKQATMMFWRNGYRGVSLDDLTQAMNINKPSLYAAFGDKEALFLAAIDHYRDTVTLPIFMELMECEKLAPGLEKFFKSLAKIVTSKDTPGCLVACMLSQESCESQAIKDKLAQTIEKADKGFTQLLINHKNELRPSVDPESAGSFLTSVLHGISIRARSGATTKDLAPIAEFAIKSICS
jgi:AcrR family transcriptional regulator